MTVLARKQTSAAEIAARFSGSTGADQSLLRRNGTGKALEDALPTISDAGRLTANRVAKPSVSATFATLLTLDGRDGDRRHVILTGDVSLSFVNWKLGQTLLLRLIQDGTGGWLATWLGVIYWPGGFRPTLTETPSHWDVVTLKCIRIAEDGTPVFQGYPSGSDFGELVVQVDCEENGGMGVCCIDGVCHEISCEACVAAGGTWMTGIAECEFGCGDCCE
jgi:hypothetical protein